MNKSGGYGVEGTSAKGDGVVGYTHVNSVSPSGGKSGVSGYDASTNKSTANSGVYGTSAYGYAVHAKSSFGTGVFAEALNGTAVSAVSQNGVGIIAQSGNSPALTATANVDAMEALSYENCCFQTGTGFLAFRSGPGSSITATASANFEEQAFPDLFDGINDTATVVTLDYYGDLVLAGTLSVQGSAVMVTKLSNKQHVAAFASRVASPTIEDTGVSRLTAGRAFVSLDPTFAQAIDPHQDYLVFITAHGDSNGLFVASTSRTGFEVKENRNGGSTLSFDYRIVAKPFETRFPVLKPTLDTPATTAYRTRIAKYFRKGR